MNKTKELLMWAEKEFPARARCHHFMYVDGDNYLLVLSVNPSNIAIDFPEEDINRPLKSLKKEILEVFKNFNQPIPKKINEFENQTELSENVNCELEEML